MVDFLVFLGCHLVEEGLQDLEFVEYLHELVVVEGLVVEVVGSDIFGEEAGHFGSFEVLGHKLLYFHLNDQINYPVSI